MVPNWELGCCKLSNGRQHRLNGQHKTIPGENDEPDAQKLEIPNCNSVSLCNCRYRLLSDNTKCVHIPANRYNKDRNQHKCAVGSLGQRSFRRHDSPYFSIQLRRGSRPDGQKRDLLGDQSGVGVSRHGDELWALPAFLDDPCGGDVSDAASRSFRKSQSNDPAHRRGL